MVYIRKVIRSFFCILPYIFVKKVINRRRLEHSILQLIELDDIIEQEECKCKYDQIVSVQGFGYSGSGAVNDLLREMNNVSVVAYKDGDSYTDITGTNEPLLNSEVDFMRSAGGLLEVERYLCSNNIFFNDALIKRSIECIDHFIKSMSNVPSKMKEDFACFYRDIIDFKISGLKYDYYNCHLNLFHFSEISRRNIFYLKKMTIEQYRNRVKKLLCSFFNYFPEAEILVIDQFFADSENNINQKGDYVENLKIINVYRDPRDVYTYGLKNHINWIPSQIEVFISWYKYNLNDLLLHESDRVLNLQFEELVMNYELSVLKVMNFLNIDNKEHFYKKKFFNPALSFKNIALWKNEIEIQNEICLIQTELPQYCYNGMK